MKSRKKIVIIGPVPPPTGGVSVHIWRLWYLLKKDFDVELIDEFRDKKPEYFNIRSLNVFRYFKIVGSSDAVFIHSGTNILRMGHILASWLLRKKIVVTVHAYNKREKDWKRLLHQFFFNLADKIIVVNPVMLERISLPAEKTIVKHAFLPPVFEEEKALNGDISNWLSKARKEGRTIICSNAWRLDVWKDQDLYGTDMCIDATAKLKRSGIPVSFVFNIATMDNLQSKFDNYQEKIKSMNLENEFLLANEKLSFVRLMEKSDVVVRPTNIDGDSLSIREAIFLGKPIITSDAVERPAGVILHENRNTEDFVQKISETIQTLKNSQKFDSNDQDLSYYAFYKDMFEALLGGKKTIQKKN